MQYAIVYVHKTNTGTRGVVSIHDLESSAMTAAANEAVKSSDFTYYVCPMQTQVSGDIQVSTTVIAATVVAPATPATPSNPAPAPAVVRGG